MAAERMRLGSNIRRRFSLKQCAIRTTCSLFRFLFHVVTHATSFVECSPLSEQKNKSNNKRIGRQTKRRRASIGLNWIGLL